MLQKRYIKGQSSVEFLAVVSLALIIAVPFIASLETAVGDIRTTSEGVAMKTTMDELELAVNTVGVEGEPSKRSMWLDLPDNIVSSQIESEPGQGDAVVFTVDRAEGPTDIFRITEFDLDEGSNIPDTSGSHRITIEAEDDEVTINPE